MKGNDNMAEKRRDHRGIVLEKGESQDSSGRYRYRYYDDKGISHDIYAWRLRPEDETPEGKKHGESLREMETRIQKDMLDNIKAWEANIAVGRLAEEYIEQQKAFWAPKTYNGMTSAYLNHVKKSLGRKKVSKVTPDMIEKHYLEMLRIVGIGTVSAVDKVLNGTFKLAIKRNMIRNNPATGCLGTIKRKCGIEEVEKHALEEEQQKDLLNFIQNDRIYSKSYNLFYLLAWTGCRIGELLGLTWYDIDFSRESININHNLIYTKVNGKYQFTISSPKTKNGNREIPMLGDVKKILLEMREEAGWSKVISVKKPKISVEDARPFVFTNSKGNLIPYMNVEETIKKIVTKYNKTMGASLQNVTPHTFRHSFCCWLCENVAGENTMDDIKYIQSIMGHKDAGTTLNIYSELRQGNAAGKHEALKKKAARM